MLAIIVNRSQEACFAGGFFEGKSAKLVPASKHPLISKTPAQELRLAPLLNEKFVQHQKGSSFIARCTMASNNPRFGDRGRQSESGNQGRQGFERSEGQHAGNAGTGVLESVRDTAENVASGVSSAAEQAWDYTRQGAQQAGHIAEDALSTTTDFMRNYPLVT